MLAALGLVCGALGIAVTVPLRAQYPATLTIPRGGELAGLKIMPGFEEETSEFERDIRRDFGVRDAYAVLLRDPAAPTEPVLFAAVTGFILNPGGELTKAMRRLTKGSRVEVFTPGPLGGHVRCGAFTDKHGELVTACGWTDHGSVGVGLFGGGRPMDDCAAKFREIRDAVLTRN
jgi:hypothetical protein